MSPTPPARAPVRVVPAAEADCAALADIYRLSFLPHALGQAMFSRADPVLVAAKLGDRFRALLASPRHAVCKAVRPGVGNAVLGFAWWELPRPVGVADGGAEEEDEEVKREWAPGTDVELVTALFADLGAHASRIEGPHLKCQSAAPSGPSRPFARWLTKPGVFGSAHAGHRPPAPKDRHRQRARAVGYGQGRGGAGGAVPGRDGW